MTFPDNPKSSERAIVPYKTAPPAVTGRTLPPIVAYAQRLLPVTVTVGTTAVAAFRLAHTIWRLTRPLRRSTSKDLPQARPAAVITEWLIQQDASGTKIAARQTIINHRG